MKSTEYTLTLPLSEVVDKLLYELRWGVIRGLVLSHTELSPHVHVLLVQELSPARRNVLLTLDDLSGHCVLRINEDPDHDWDRLLGQLLIAHRIPPQD